MGTLPITLRVCQLNCENLFAFFIPSANQPSPLRLTEAEWQSHSSSAHENKSLFKLRCLAKTLTSQAPDIILLNEIGGLESLEVFNRHFLGECFQPYWIEGNSDRGIDVGYLVRKSLPFQYLLISHRRRPIDLQYPWDSKNQGSAHFFSRDCLELRVFFPGVEPPLMVFLLVHLKSKRDPDGRDPEGRLRRKAEAEALGAIYNEIRVEHPHTPIVAGGDFNGIVFGPEAEEEFTSIRERTDLVDPFSGRSSQELATAMLFSRSQGLRALRLDYILVSPHLRPLIDERGSGVRPLQNEEGQSLPWPSSLEQRQAQPSDHLPVVLVLRDIDQLHVKNQNAVRRD